jgi:predicted PurR-regulated permease PerM
MADPLPSRDLTRTLLAVLVQGALLLASLWILRPFLVPLLWAALLVVATWPTFLRLQTLLAGRRWLAVTTMLGLLLLVFVVPFSLILSVLVDNAPAIAAWVKGLPERLLAPPPEWVREVPLVGTRAAETWAQWAAEGREGLALRLAPHADELAAWFVAQIGGVGLTFVHFLLTLILSGVLYARGEVLAADVRRFARRLFDERGDRAAVLAGNAVRAVAFGVVVTALVQSAIGGIGLVVAGVPAAGVLTGVMFVSSVAQIGAAPVLALAAVWLFTQDHSGWGIAMVVWTVFVGSLDNVIRPVLIRKGVDLPLALVFSGVVGGLIAWGAVGLFAGPVLLAVGHTLLGAWLAEGDSAAPAGDGSAA